jgi:hypothetical protein
MDEEMTVSCNQQEGLIMVGDNIWAVVADICTAGGRDG